MKALPTVFHGLLSICVIGAVCTFGTACARTPGEAKKPLLVSGEHPVPVQLVKASKADLRASPDHHSERLTQLLMGMPVQILKTQANRRLVKGPDGKAGWTDDTALSTAARRNSTAQANVQVRALEAPLRAKPAAGSPVLGTAFKGSPLFSDANHGNYLQIRLPDGTTAWLEKSKSRTLPNRKTPVAAKRRQIAADAGDYLGASYLWGGITSRGIDCSGLTFMAYYVNGLTLPRDSKDQFAAGHPVREIQYLKPGDLVFFSFTRPGASHVGLYLGDGQFIHSSPGKGVRVSSLADPRYHRHFYGARRYLSD